MRASEDDLKFYDNIIKEQVKLGFVEEVPQIFPKTGNIHYLAHRGVKRDSETTPLRVVYDCSAKSDKDKPSLNECLYVGPNLINNLSSIILRFRLGNYAITGDIKKAFLCIGIREYDRDATRFL